MNTNRTIESSKPLILLVFATDALDSLKTEVEMQSLQSILEPIAQRLDYEVQILEYSTIDHFIDCLDDNRDRLILLHFAGHSNSELLQLDEGEAHAQGLAGKLQACQYLQLLFLNGCSNAHQVQRFVEVGIPATIGTYYPINDSIACEFSEAFYTELVARQQPIASAFKQAKETISTKYGSKYHSLNVRSFGDENEDIIPKKWAWFLEQQIEEHEWKFEDAAHACNRLPILPPKTTQDLPDLLFKNLYYYQSSDADIFFGRCQATLDILTLLDNADYPLLLLHGGTGVGKSSFLMAGLIPRILARQQVVNQPFRYDEHISLKNLLPRIFDASNIADIYFQLDVSNEQPSIWILDQVEEIFFQPEKETTLETPDNTIQKEERQDSIPDALNLLLKTLKALFPANRKEQWPNARIIFTLRTEWFGELHDACRKYQLANQDYMLKPLDKADIIEIIEQPTKKQLLIDKYGLQIEKLPLGKLSAQIADDLLEDRESNIAPPLQIILSKLWQDVEKLPKQERIWTQQLYEQKKAQGLLLSEHLDHQLQEIGTLSNQQHGNWGQEANDSGLLIDILHSYTTIQGTSKTRSIDDYNIHYAHIPYRSLLARTFIDRYLLIDPSNERQQYRLAHDTLAKVVKAKYETSERPGQRARRLLDSRKTDWIKIESEFKGAALDKFDLKLIEIGETGTRDWHQDEIEVAIINKSQKKRRNGRFIFSGVIIGFIVAFLVTALLYFQAEEQRQRAEDQVLETNYSLSKVFEEKILSFLSKGDADKVLRTNYFRQAWLYALEAKKLKIPKGKKNLSDKIINKLYQINSYYLFNTRIDNYNKNTSYNTISTNPKNNEFASGSTDGRIIIWSSTTGAQKLSIQAHHSPINSLKYSPDGKKLASGSGFMFENKEDNRETIIRIWNPKTGELLLTLKGHEHSIQALDFSNNGKKLISAGWDGKIIVCDLSSGRIVNILFDNKIKIYSLIVKNNIIAAGFENGDIALFDINSGEKISSFNGGKSAVYSLAFSNNGKLLATGSSDNIIRIWNISTGKLVKLLNGHESSINTLSFNNDDTILASGSGAVRDFKYGTLGIKMTGGSASDIDKLMSVDNTVRLWDTKTGIVKQIFNEYKNSVNSLSYSTDGSMIFTASKDGYIKILDSMPPNHNGKFSGIIENNKSRVNSLSFNPKDNSLAIAYKEGDIKILNIKNFKVKLNISTNKEFRSIVFNSSGDFVVSSSYDEDIEVREVKTDKLVKSYNIKNNSLVAYNLIFTPNDKELIASSIWKTIILDARKDKIKLALEYGPATLLKKKRKIVLINNYLLEVWDIDSEKTIKKIKYDTDSPTWHIASNSNGSEIATCSDDAARIYDINTGKLKFKFQMIGSPQACDYHPTDNIIALGSTSGFVNIMDTKTGKLIYSYKVDHTIFDIKYSNDGTTIVTGGSNGKINIWRENKISHHLLNDFNPEKISDLFRKMWRMEINKETLLFSDAGNKKNKGIKKLFSSPDRGIKKSQQVFNFIKNNISYKRTQ